MDYSKPGFWIAILVGGAIVASLSAAQQYMTNEPSTPFTFRPVLRDFCLGSFMTATIYMFLPDSVDSWISAGKDSLTQLSMNPATDVELQTGPARF